MKVYGTFNFGTDTSITIVDQTTGLPIDVGGRVMDWDPSPIDTLVESKGIADGGKVIRRVAYDGWKATLKFDRAVGNMDRLQSALEAGYYGGGGQRYFSVTEKTRNSEDGSVDVRLFKNCTMQVSSGGPRQKAALVSYTLTFTGSEATAL